MPVKWSIEELMSMYALAQLLADKLRGKIIAFQSECEHHFVNTEESILGYRSLDPNVSGDGAFEAKCTKCRLEQTLRYSQVCPRCNVSMVFSGRWEWNKFENAAPPRKYTEPITPDRDGGEQLHICPTCRFKVATRIWLSEDAYLK